MYEHGQFSPDGQTIYVTTNEASEFSRAARMDLDNGRIVYLSDDNVDVDWLKLSPDGRLLALVRNDDGYGRLSILDLAKRRRNSRRPTCHDGIPMEPAWSSDSRRLAFAFTPPSQMRISGSGT